MSDPALQEIRDRNAVQDVMGHYARCLDDEAFDEFRELFLPEVEVHGLSTEPMQGVDAWLLFVEKALAAYAGTQHMLGPPLVELDGDRARARTDLRAIHLSREAGGGIFTVFGTYRTDMVKGDGGWKIARHELKVRTVQNSA